MLTLEEKDFLYEIISYVIGDDSSIRNRKMQFNDQTVTVVEEMIITNKNCNANMLGLVKSLLGGSATLAKGWLKKILKKTKKTLDNAELKGYGCMVSVKARWKTAIINSTI